MRLRVIFVLFALVSFVVAGAQEVTPKQKVLSVKKSKDYIYGEATGDNEDDCYAIAKEKLLAKVKEYIATDPELSQADGVIIDNVSHKTKKLTYERSLSIKVVCLYVSKKDILPLHKSKGAPSTIITDTKSAKRKINIVPIDEKASSEDNDDMYATSKRVENTSNEEDKTQLVSSVNTIQSGSTDVEYVEPSFEESSDSQVSADSQESSVSQISEDSQVSARQESLDGYYTATERAVLQPMLCMNTYDDVKSHLEDYKQQNHNLLFKLVANGYDADNCFWVVFDKQRTLLAILDRSCRRDILTGASVNKTTYSGNPKIWIQIYE